MFNKINTTWRYMDTSNTVTPAYCEHFCTQLNNCDHLDDPCKIGEPYTMEEHAQYYDNKGDCCKASMLRP